MVIEELERDSRYDYVKILRALLELPFNVGRTLLVEFLQGKYTNKSVMKNNLSEYHMFGTLHWDREEILAFVDRLLAARMIEEVPMEGNRFVKLLSLTLKGKNEIAVPTLLDSPAALDVISQFEITENDRLLFEEYRDFLSSFNDEQKKAIVANDKTVLTVAGAGSGKTTVLVHRIAFLVSHRNVLPEEILAITFTRKARDEMLKRLQELGIVGVEITTFHSFCEHILRKHGTRLYGRRSRVLTYQDKILSLNLALYHLNIDMKELIDLYFSKHIIMRKSFAQLQGMFMNDCFAVLDYYRVTGQELADFSNDVEEGDRGMAKMVYQILQYLLEHKRTQGLRSFADQLVDVVDFFKRDPSIIPYYDHVLVDEYQDVNALQVDILSLLNFDHIFAVGDPRQSIFGWRGSDVRFIQKFADYFGDGPVIHLVKNYRSLAHVVKFMNLSISSMGLPDLEHHLEGDGNLKLFSFENEEAELTFVLQVLQAIVPTGEQVFVLARTNRQLFEFGDLLKREGIDFMIKGDDSVGPAKESEKVSSSVVLATVHAIKGLEAEHVFVIGCNKDSFPSRASDHRIVELLKDDYYDKDEEERRLFYVAISRAKRHLYLTYTGTQTQYITESMKGLLK